MKKTFNRPMAELRWYWFRHEMSDKGLNAWKEVFYFLLSYGEKYADLPLADWNSTEILRIYDLRDNHNKFADLQFESWPAHIRNLRICDRRMSPKKLWIGGL
jgi:hypothetical protein